MHPTLAGLADDVRIGGWVRSLQPERPMRTMPVVMSHVDSKDSVQVRAPRSAASPGTRHGPCRQTVLRRRSRWAPGPVSAPPRRPPSGRGRRRRGRTSRRGRAIRSGRGVPVRPAPAAGSGPAGRPRPRRVGGHTGQVDPTGVQFDGEQHIQPLQPDRVEGEEVAGEGSGGCWRRNACHVVLARRGAGPDRGGAGLCGSRSRRPARQAEAAHPWCAGSPSGDSPWPGERSAAAPARRAVDARVHDGG